MMRDIILRMIRLFEDRPDLLDIELEVETLKIILLENYHLELDKRQIGRALKQMGFEHRNANVKTAPLTRQKSMYSLDKAVFLTAKVKYNIDEKKEV